MSNLKPAPAGVSVSHVIIVQALIDGYTTFMEAPFVNTMTILLIGENAGQLLTLQKNLLQTHHRILVADNQTASVSYFEQERPELVVIDMAHPIAIDPYGVCIELRQLLGGRDAMILAIVPDGDDNALTTALNAGVDDCVTTSTHPRLLLRRVETLLVASQGRIDQNAILTTQHQAEVKYRKLFNSSSDAIFIVDLITGRFLDVNRSAMKWLGFDRDELLSMRYTDIEVAFENNGAA